MFTSRIYYNRELWREILGDTPEPKTFAEFREVARRAQAQTDPDGAPLVALAGAFRNSWVMIDREFGSQTQKLSLAIDLDHNLTPASTEVAVAWLRGQWSSDGPEFGRGLAVARDLVATMGPGFVQQTRDDATFMFLQRRALMVIAGSWDYTSLASQAAFPLGVFNLPLPANDDPAYGADMLGEMNEAETGAQSAFTINATSPHQKVALDFLHFITSVEGNRLFTEKSRWLPAIVGLEPAPELRPLMPVIDGFPNGFNARLLANLGFETRRLWESHMGLLGSPRDGVAQVQDIYREQLPDALRGDLVRLIAAARANIIRQDTSLAALTGAMRAEGDPAERLRAERKRSDIFQQQTAREAETYWAEAELAAATKTKP
jgi:raffinose/stachyose/melibiose transport system substrate-binding protein